MGTYVGTQILKSAAQESRISFVTETARSRLCDEITREREERTANIILRSKEGENRQRTMSRVSKGDRGERRKARNEDGQIDEE